MIRTTSRIGFSLLVPVALTVGASGLQAQEAMAEHCTASFSHESISIQAEPVMLIATLSQEIGDIEKGISRGKRHRSERGEGQREGYCAVSRHQ
jgi:hypothetical protein